MFGETVTVELSEELAAGVDELVERGYPDRGSVVREAIRRRNAAGTSESEPEAEAE